MKDMGGAGFLTITAFRDIFPDGKGVAFSLGEKEDP